jgi:hypothetical protein
MTFTYPALAPVAVGLNVTLKVQFVFGAKLPVQVLVVNVYIALAAVELHVAFTELFEQTCTETLAGALFDGLDTVTVCGARGVLS